MILPFFQKLEISRVLYYCYRHLKENLNIVVTKHNTRGNKGKESTLQWLDGIAYARRDEDYDANLFEV